MINSRIKNGSKLIPYELDSLLIIAAVTLAIVCIMAGFIAYHDYTVVRPQAEEQYKYIQTLNCDQVFSFPQEIPIHSMENRILLSDKADVCTEIRELAAQKEKERLDALLADPNSYESLSREYKKLEESLAEAKKKYATLSNETSILRENIEKYENRMTEIEAKITIPKE